MFHRADRVAGAHGRIRSREDALPGRRPSWKARAASAANAAFRRLDLAVVRASKLRQLRAIDYTTRGPSAGPAALPPGAAEHLTTDNPRLRALRDAYAALDLPVTRGSLWSREYVAAEIDLRAFRGDNAFVWQQRAGFTPAALLLSTYYALQHDALGLLRTLEEDELFGVWSMPWDGSRRTSRDLVDSVLEIGFLEEHLALSRRHRVTVLDVGAGYGRLAHRLVSAFPRVEVLCADAIPESTFIAEYYLRFRGASPRARAVTLDALATELSGRHIDVAVNVHSFSECPLAAVGWWLDRLAEHRVPHLMIVPNTGDRIVSLEPDNRRLDLAPELAHRGYREVARRPKYLDPAVQSHGVAGGSHYFLFALTQERTP